MTTLMLLAGCGGGNKKIMQEQRHAWHQEQARLFDIPVPITAEPDLSFFSWSDDYENRVMGYTVTAQSSQEVIDFYRANMERLGWQERATIDGYETLLQFEKPEKICCVSVRCAHDTSIRLVLSVGMISDC